MTSLQRLRLRPPTTCPKESRATPKCITIYSNGSRWGAHHFPSPYAPWVIVCRLGVLANSSMIAQISEMTTPGCGIFASNIALHLAFHMYQHCHAHGPSCVVCSSCAFRFIYSVHYPLLYGWRALINIADLQYPKLNGKCPTVIKIYMFTHFFVSTYRVFWCDV